MKNIFKKFHLISPSLFGKLFILFYSSCLIIIISIATIYHFSFKSIKKQHLVTPVIINAGTKTLKTYQKDLFKKINPFGFIHYGDSIESYDQIKNLNKDLRALFPHRKIYITIDHEGGNVDRLREISSKLDLQLLKSASHYGNIASKNLEKAKLEIYKDSRTTAKLLKDLGFDINLAPMLDVANNKKHLSNRIYSHNPKITIELGKKFIEAMQKEGIMTTLKHMPGIGRSKGDTHHQKVYINTSKNDLAQTDLLPFRKLAKISKFGMVSHAIYPKIENKPATASKKTIDFIIKQTGFKGFLISDALNMKGVSSLNAYNQNAKDAFNAGIDIIIPNCSDHICNISIIKAAKEIGLIEKFNKKLKNFEKNINYK